jgi:hypothetical protein
MEFAGQRNCDCNNPSENHTGKPAAQTTHCLLLTGIFGFKIGERNSDHPL